MKKMISLILITVFPVFAVAEDKDVKLRKLMEAQGLFSMFENELELSKEQGERMGRQMMDKLLARINPDEEFQRRFSEAFKNYINKIAAPWGEDEIVSIWSQYYGQHFTEVELDLLLEFYGSSVGQKNVEVSQDALVKFADHIQKLGAPILQDATLKYYQEIKLLAKECNCQK